MEKCKWRATFNIKPSLSKSESLGGFNFECLSNGGTIITCEYETSSYGEKHPERNTNGEYAEQTLARQDAQIIRQILLKRMIYQRCFVPISVGLIERPSLTNRDALSSQGLLGLRTVSNLHIAQYSSLDTGDSLEESQLFWDRGFNHASKGQQAEVLRIADWIEKSYAEHDDIQSFILAWIAFEGLSGLFCTSIEKPDRDKTSKFILAIKELVPGTQARSILNNIDKHAASLANLDLYKYSNREDFSIQLKNALQQKHRDESRVLGLVARHVYEIRNQIFHEAPHTAGIRYQAKTAKLALLPIVESCLKTFISDDKN